MMQLLTQNLQFWFSGIGVTLTLTAIAVLLGFALSAFLTWVKIINIPLLNKMVDAYVFIIRGTPFLIQLFLIYYGPLELPWIAHTRWLSALFSSAVFCAVLSLTINTSAYTTALFTGAFNNLPKEEVLAAQALGMSQWIIFQKIIFPRILMRILPVYANEIIMILKCTALVSTITILDIMGIAQQITAQTYQTLSSLLIAGGIYLIITVGIAVPLKYFFTRYCRVI